MASFQKTEKDEALHDSWVELHFHGTPPPEQVAPSDQADPLQQRSLSGLSIHNGQMEKLLIEAQRESSRSSSRVTSTVPSNCSSRASPKSPHSPNNEWANSEFNKIQEERSLLKNTDWIWDWSSRPEAMPPIDFSGRFKHPKKARLSVRNTSVMRNGLFCLENLPALLVTHATTFFLGAAAMFLFLKKYCHWTPAPTLD